ncbi:MAG: nitrite/sulfite reductase [Campylobacteraceae bacterium]|nr:nitrite/sulfite reductase [Campylobacteraceae bacterium]
MLTETKTQRVERIKQAKDGLEVINDIYVYAVMGLKVEPDDIDRFKWYGLSPQDTKLQDKNDQTLYFTLCVKVQAGQLDIKQLQILESISKDFSRNTAHLTFRQNMQFSFIQVRNIPEIFRRLDSVGLSSKFAAGDVPRNIVSCAVNGIDYDQISDVRPIVEKVNKYLDGNKKFSNLPRQFKVAISGCHSNCINHEIQDICFTAVKISETKTLFDVNITEQETLINIGQVTASQILSVVKAISIIFRDHGDRSNRENARVGYILQKWGKEQFLKVLHQEINFTLKIPRSNEIVNFSKKGHLGIYESTVRSQSYVGVNIEEGNLGLIGIENLLLLLKKYSANTIKLTANQNIVILDVPSNQVTNLYNNLAKLKLHAVTTTVKDKTTSCTL